MRRATARDTWKTPWVFTAKVAAQSSSLNDTAGPVRSTPATLTRTPMGPSSRSIVSTTRSTAVLSPTSAAKAAARAPRSRSSATSAATFPSWTSSAAITASPASARATAAPIPCAAPVTSATFWMVPMAVPSAQAAPPLLASERSTSSAISIV